MIDRPKTKSAGFLVNLRNNRERLIVFTDRSSVLSLYQSPLPVPKRAIAQPLPMDIRDWSFRGLDCRGWDFSGRDIRGCDFRNAKLNAANFTKVIAGRSTKQQTRDIIIVVAGAVAVAVAGSVGCVLAD